MFWRKKTKTPQELFAAGDYKGAILGFEESLKGKKEPDPTVLMQLASSYQKLNRLTEAKRVFILVGTYYGDRGFFNKSVAAFKKALVITPDDHEILEKLAGYNDKVPKFMIDANILAKLKKDAAAHQTGEHQQLTEEELAQSSLEEPSQETPEDLDSTDLEIVEFETDHMENIDDTLPHADSSTDFSVQDLYATEAQAPKTAPQELGGPDQTYEEIIDLDGLDMEDEQALDLEMLEEPEADADSGFGMNFGKSAPIEEQAKPQPAAPTEPKKPAPIVEQAKSRPAAPTEPKKPAPSRPSSQKFEQPITRGGMVFKSQVEPQKAATTSASSGGFFDSFDDALDNMFSPGSGGGIFATASAAKSTDSLELTLADASPEENAKHWPLFRTMPQDVFMAFVLALETRDYEIGDNIVIQGEAGDEMFLIADGTVDILVKIGGEPTKVAQLNEGDLFGEASLLSGEPRNATVRAATPTNCLLLSRTDLNKLLKDHPSVMASIESIYYTRIQENASRKGEATK